MAEGAFRPLDVVDEGTFVQTDEPPAQHDPLGYPSYAKTLEEARARSGSDESVATGSAQIGGHRCELARFEFDFLGGSMGEVAGERLARAMERAASSGIPFVLMTATGGARMQEGMRSLVQMPKVVAARLALADAHVPFIAALGPPTTGGVLASIAALADVTIAVVGATVGFAGPRIVERQTGRPMREGSHTAESALASGLVDEVVPPNEIRERLVDVLACLAPDEVAETPTAPGEGSAEPPPPSGSAEPWDAVVAARSSARPSAPSLALAALDSSLELRGDRAGADDPGARALLGRLAGRRVMILALDRARPPGPHAYRKAIRAARIAARLRLPVATLVDTPGADASEDSEAGGIAWAIAELFETVLSIPVPVISIVTGEGGSGGALAFACGDVLISYDDTIFSVIGPELAAEILFRDSKRAEEAAGLLRLTARDLLELGIADALVPGPPTSGSLRDLLAYHLAGSDSADPATRRRRWRSI